MSWADDIRCLYCDGRLPLYRKITNGQFCSAAHRKAYWQEQERLAVERLHQTHDSLRAYKPRDPVEAILGPEPPAAEVAPVVVQPDPQPERPAWLVIANSSDVPMAGFVRETSVVLKPRWMADRLIAELSPMPATIALRTWFGRAPLALLDSRDPDAAGLVVMPRFEPLQVSFAILAPATAHAPFNIFAVRRITRAADPVTEEMEWRDVQAPAPLSEILFALARFSPLSPRVWRCEFEPSAEEWIVRAQFPVCGGVFRPDLALSRRVPLAVRSLPADSGASILAAPAGALEIRSKAELAAHLAAHLESSASAPALRMAPGCRYVIEPSGAVTLVGSTAIPSNPQALSVLLPQRETKVIRGAVTQTVPQPARDFEPAATGLRKLEFSADAVDWRGIRPAPPAFFAPQPPRPDPLRPAMKLDPLSFSSPAAPAPAVPVDPLRSSNFWAHSADFWHRAPRDLKTLAFAIPLLLVLALHPGLPKVRVAAPTSASGFRRNFESAMNEHWASFRQSVFDRAAVALDEDFRSGLDDWASRGDATATWSFDETGFVRPGPLALYRPSMGLNDYEFQFLGLIDKKALSWVVRAADFDNYYVVKIEILKPGPVPTVGITRYAVVNGKADARADVVAPIDARNDMLYRVRMDVHGDEFALMIQDQMVDAWSEPRLSHGGIGFFTAQGEESRLRWVQVTHQYDMLGRLCAYLAPYNNPPVNGTSEQ